MIDHLCPSVSHFARSTAFYKAALGAIVFDPDGHNIEAVYHGSYGAGK